jgi:hypothetical protein
MCAGCGSAFGRIYGNDTKTETETIMPKPKTKSRGSRKGSTEETKLEAEGASAQDLAAHLNSGGAVKVVRPTDEIERDDDVTDEKPPAVTSPPTSERKPKKQRSEAQLASRKAWRDGRKAKKSLARAIISIEKYPALLAISGVSGALALLKTAAEKIANAPSKRGGQRKVFEPGQVVMILEKRATELGLTDAESTGLQVVSVVKKMLRVKHLATSTTMFVEARFCQLDAGVKAPTFDADDDRIDADEDDVSVSDDEGVEDGGHPDADPEETEDEESAS